MQDFLGTGWSFPPTFSKVAGTVAMTSAEEDIARSLEILMGTAVGERVMRPEYGCDLSELLFEPLDVTMETYFSVLIKESVLLYEPRVIADDVRLYKDQYNQGLVTISIDYTIISTNTRLNFVYPFYINEATNLIDI